MALGASRMPQGARDGGREGQGAGGPRQGGGRRPERAAGMAGRGGAERGDPEATGWASR